MPSLWATGPQQRQDDERDLEEVEEEREEEDEDVDRDQEADPAARQPDEHVLDPLRRRPCPGTPAENTRAPIRMNTTMAVRRIVAFHRPL